MPVSTRLEEAPQWPENDKASEATDLNPRAQIGGNEPPLEERIGAEFTDALLTDRPDFMTRYADMIAAKDRVEVSDDDSLGRAGDLIKMYRAADKHISETHKVVKEPHLLAGRAVDAKKNELLGDLADARDAVQGKMNAYAAKKHAAEKAEREAREAEERRQAEEAARAQREREAAEREQERLRLEAEEAGKVYEAPEPAPEPEIPVAIAPAAPAKSEPVRSDAGSTVSGKTVWNSKVTDYEVAFIGVSDDEKVRDAIDKAIARRVRAGSRNIEGVQIWETAQAVAR